jgi:hypothetical protein
MTVLSLYSIPISRSVHYDSESEPCQTLAVPCQPATCYRSVNKLLFMMGVNPRSQQGGEGWETVLMFHRVLIALAQFNSMSVSLSYHDHGRMTRGMSVLDSAI